MAPIVTAGPRAKVFKVVSRIVDIDIPPGILKELTHGQRTTDLLILAAEFLTLSRRFISEPFRVTTETPEGAFG